MITKILKNDNILSLLANLVTSGIAFISFILVARILIPIDFGAWTLYLTFFTFFDMFRSGLIHTALIRFGSGEEQNEYIGAAWKIVLGFTVGVSLLVYLSGFIYSQFGNDATMNLFFFYFPFLFLANLPIQVATWVLQMRMQFQKILYVRMLSTIPLFCLLSIHFFHHYLSLEYLIVLHILTFVLASFVVILFNWTGIKNFKLGKKEHFTNLLHFGKFSTGTLIGTNLLKSSDSFLLGGLLGPIALAFYSIPQKLTELMELPVRSLATTALPKLSKASMQNDLLAVRKIFMEYIVLTTLLILPIVAVCILFAKYLVIWIGGEEYQSSILILQVFAIYGLFLPLDKLLGVTLDCLNFPKFNMIKVILMVVVNVIGDLIAIFVFKSVWLVAGVTTLTMITGIIIGGIYLHKIVKFESNDFKEAVNKLVQKIRKR